MKEHNIATHHVDKNSTGELQNTTLKSESYFKDFVFNMKMMILEINILIGWVESADNDNDN